jgi:isochorismate pyruvate lyase
MTPEQTFASLSEVRAAIDRLDRELVHLLAERASCVAAAAPFKASEQEVQAPDRVASMLRARREWAEAAGISPDFVESLFRSITSYFISQEFSHWRGGAGPKQPG